jgi:hypothetical protein
MPAITDPAILNRAAYGGVPVIPPFSTNTSESTSTSTPNLPNYDALASAASMIAQNQMGGQLNPQDLANAQTWAAQRGVASGTGFGSPNNMAAYQQFLGLSAQQLEQQGLTNYQGLLAGAPRTTNTSGSQTIDNNVLAAEYAAAPDPYAAAMANLAAQQAGLAGGAGAGVGTHIGTGAGTGSGTGAGTGAGGQSAYQAAQSAAAAHGMGTTAGGAGTAPSAWSMGTGPAGGAPPISGGTAAGGQGTGISGGSNQVTSGQSGVAGARSVDEFLAQLGIDSSQMSQDDIDALAYMFGWEGAGGGGGGPALNPETGLYDYGSGYTGGYGGGTGTTGNLGGLGFGNWYSGGYSGGASGGAESGSSAWWQQLGYPSEQAYYDDLDASIFGWETEGGGGSSSGEDTTGNLGGLGFGNWYSGGASGGAGSGVVGSPGNEYVVGLGGATYPINSDGYGSYAGYGSG